MVNKTIQRTIGYSLLMLILFVAGGLASVSYADTGTYTDGQGVEWIYETIASGDKTVVSITGCTDESIPQDGNLTVPQSINEYPVDRIADSAFSGNGKLQDMTIPEGVQTIGSQSFYGCTNLKSVQLPTGLKIIGGYAFTSCPLTEVDIPDSVTVISWFAFMGCRSLKTVHFPANLESIGMRAFYNCALTEANLPDSVTEIGMSAFQMCMSLESVKIPSGVTKIEGYTFNYSGLKQVTIPKEVQSIDSTAFGQCFHMTEINVEEGNLAYTSKDGVLFGDNDTTLMMYPCAKKDSSYVIPEGVLRVENNAFQSNPFLTEVTLAKTTQSLGDFAFSACMNLSKINFLGAQLSSIGANAFEVCGALKQITLPDSVKVLGANAFYGSGLTSIVIPGSIGEVKSQVFLNCASLEEVILSDGVGQIENYAFMGSIHLKRVWIPASVVTIADMAFENAGTQLPEVEVLTIVTEQGTAAEAYAKEKNLGLALQMEQQINLPKSSYTMDYGKSLRLQATAHTPLSYESLDPAVVSVSADGVVTPKELGTARIQITAKAGVNYASATRIVPVNVCLATPKIKAKNKKNKQVKISWNKVTGASGYEVFVKCPGEKKYYKRATRSSKIKSVTHMGLKKGKTYRYKVRAFRTVNGNKVYGKFSSVKKIKVRK